ncbi:MAG: PAS domain S-box protein [Alphaproteobacteria bacterium]|nr:PAS domain S-box protein [Alphaproteobacteria bacterium]
MTFEGWQACVHAEDRDRATDDVRAALRGERPLDTEFRIVRSNGTTCHLKSVAQVYRDPANTPIRMVGINYDITERKLAEDELFRSQQMLRTFFDRSMVGMATLSPNRDWIEVNPALCDMLGYSPEELRTTTWVDLTHPDDLELNIALFERLLRGEINNYRLDKRFIRKDGRIVDAFVAVAGVRDETGALELLVAIFEDISERKAAESKMIRSKDEAEQANRAKSAFLAMMSHEIRTPMTGVIGMADFLAGTTLSKDQKLYIDTMRSSAQTLLTVLNDILDYSKIDANRLRLDCISFDVLTLVAEAARLFCPKAEENTSSIRLDTGGLVTLVVRGDPTRIKQVLGNLLGNAVKFTKNGTITVRLRSRDEGGLLRLMFEVEDTGIGISEVDMGRLFVPFSQADAGTTRKFGGTGLGLVICKRLVELMGGEIGVTSHLGRGSLFRFTCLVEYGRLEDLVVGPQPAIAVHPMTILLAEDNPINRMIVKLGLEQRHHRVTMVENGVQAYEAAAGQHFDVILMDMQMPVMDGTEATRRIRTLPPPFSEVPIVALTADALAEHRLAYMAAGLTDFLTKPVEWGEVDTVLARLQLGISPLIVTIADIDRQDFDGDQVPLVDRSRILAIRTIMTPEAFDGLIGELVPCSREEVSNLKLAITQRNLTLAHRAAHTIKGMYLNFGGVRVAALAKQLQECNDIGSADALFRAVATAVDETAIELERFTADILN